MVKTVGSILEENKGCGPGFDWCRLGLATLVVALHAHNVCYGYSIQPEAVKLYQTLFASVKASVLPLFFGLSGFLVTGSALRLRNTSTFIIFRILRIVPALMTEVTMSALILGPLLTSLPLKTYFSDRHVYSYFGNVIGRIQFELPGLFDGLPIDRIVNGNLWTLHPEFQCYGIMAALMILGVTYNRRALNGDFWGTVLVYYFVTGSVAFHWRHNIPVNGYLFALACGAGYFLLKLPNTAMVAPIPVLYAIIWLGMQRFPQVKHLQKNDYSYGIYLYSFPIQQTIVYLGYRDWWIVFPLALTVSLVVAAFSWRFIEMPTLLLKRYLIKERPILPAAQFGSI